MSEEIFDILITSQRYQNIENFYTDLVVTDVFAVVINEPHEKDAKLDW